MAYVLSALGFDILDDLSEQLDFLRNEGINHLEFRGAYNRWLVDFSESEITDMARLIHDKGVEVSSVASPAGKQKITEPFSTDDLKKSLKYASLFGSSNLRIFSFMVPDREDSSKYRNQVMDRLGEMITVASGCPITLCHENEPGTFGATLEGSLAIYETHPDIRAVFDTANFTRSGCEPLECAVRLHHQIEYLHVKDMSKETGKYVPIGEGDAQIREVLDELKTEKRQLFLTLEPSLGGYVDGKRQLTGPTRFKQSIVSLRRILSEL